MNNNTSPLLKTGTYAAILITLVVVQNTVFAANPIHGVVPDLMLAAVMTIAVYHRENDGALFGLCAGVITEAVGGVGISILPFFYLAAGYIGGRIGRNARKSALFAAWLITIPFAYIVRGLLTFINILIYYRLEVDFLGVLSGTVMPAFLYSIAVALPVYLLVKLIETPLRKTKKI